jgi:hypothetical protein
MDRKKHTRRANSVLPSKHYHDKLGFLLCYPSAFQLRLEIGLLHDSNKGTQADTQSLVGLWDVYKLAIFQSPQSLLTFLIPFLMFVLNPLSDTQPRIGLAYKVKLAPYSWRCILSVGDRLDNTPFL